MAAMGKINKTNEIIQGMDTQVNFRTALKQGTVELDINYINI